MNRRKKVTQADFNQCILDLQNKNITPSVSTIVREIGGSYTTIGKMFTHWQEENAVLDTSSYDVPGDVMDEANKLLMKWWNKIQEEASRSIRQIQESTARQIAQSQSEVAPLLEDLEEMESEIEQLKRRHESEITVLINQHKSEMKVLKTEISGLTENKGLLETALAEKSKEAQDSVAEYAGLHKKYTDLVDKLAEIKRN